MATFKSYLTSLEPNMSQEIYSQSIGGYCSNSLVYPETTLGETMGIYDTTISLNTPASGNWNEWLGIEYINIGNEMIKVSPIDGGSVTVLTRGYNGIINMHVSNDDVRAVSSKELFNDVLNTDHKQYRCIALKNVSSTSYPSGELSAYNFEVYLKQNSRSDDSFVKIAIEQPASQYVSGVSTGFTAMTLVDTSLIGIYEDNHFKEIYLRILSGDASGQGKIVSSFDSATGTFTFYNSFSSTYDYNENVLYEGLPSPAQRIKTGTVSPNNVVSGNITPFTSAIKESPLRFVSGNISVPIVRDLFPNDIVYVWFERSIKKGSVSFDNNDIVLNIGYSVSV